MTIPRTPGRKIRGLGLGLFALVVGSLAAAAEVPPQDPIVVSVIATNDLHGNLRQLPLFGGYVANLRAARAAVGGGVVLLDAGDMFQGTLESNLREGATVVEAFNLLGYHAAAIGNHEFDFGPVGPQDITDDPAEDPLGALRARAREAAFPLLAGNLIHQGETVSPSGDLRGEETVSSPLDPPRETLLTGDNISASTLLRVADVTIGVVGGTAIQSLSLTQPKNVQELRTTPLAAAIRREARALRTAGATVVVALVHAGGACRKVTDPRDLSSCQDDSELFELARALDPDEVDVIVGGHIHFSVAHYVNGIPLIESFSSGRAFGRVDLVIDRRDGRVKSSKIHPPRELCKDDLDRPVCAEASYAGRPVERDPRLAAFVRASLNEVRPVRDAPLGVTALHEFALDRRRPHSPLSNLFVDWTLAAHPGADAAVNNRGGLRQGLPKGPLTYGDLFETFPFNNYSATVRMRGADLARVLARNLTLRGRLIALGGLRARASCVKDELQVKIVRADGATVEDDEILRIVTSDFVASGGGGILDGIEISEENVTFHRNALLRDAIAKHLRETGGTIDATASGLTGPRIEYPGEFPVRCPAAAR